MDSNKVGTGGKWHSILNEPEDGDVLVVTSSGHGSWESINDDGGAVTWDSSVTSSTVTATNVSDEVEIEDLVVKRLEVEELVVTYSADMPAINSNFGDAKVVIQYPEPMKEENNMNFEKFMSAPPSLSLFILFMTGTLVWFVGAVFLANAVPALWNWFDDGDSDIEFDTKRNRQILATVSFSPLTLFLTYLFPYGALSLAILVVMTFLARTGWRLKKKFGKHIVNFTLHKKPRKES